jgi:hypothetical protein
VGKEIAEAGHSLFSQTLFPQAFAKKGLDYVYCDLAGYGENRGKEESICTSSGTLMLVNYCSSVKGVFLVIDFPSFSVSRGEFFKQMLELLAKVIKGNYNLVVSNVHFIITKAPESLKKEDFIKEIIRPMLGYSTAVVGQTLFARLAQGKLSLEEAAMTRVLNTMCENPDRIFIPNIFDEGESADLIEHAVMTNSPIDKENFDFSLGELVQKRFNTLLKNIIEDLISNKKKIDSAKREIDSIDHKISNIIREKKKVKNKFETAIAKNLFSPGQPGGDSRFQIAFEERKACLKVLEEEEVELLNKKSPLIQKSQKIQLEVEVSDSLLSTMYEMIDIFGPNKDEIMAKLNGSFPQHLNSQVSRDLGKLKTSPSNSEVKQFGGAKKPVGKLNLKLVGMFGETRGREQKNNRPVKLDTNRNKKVLV